MNTCEATLEVPNPDLWWPVGHGEQALYTVKTTLVLERRIVEQDVKRIGFRHVRVNQETHPAGGRYFCFEINGKPIFCKGANFVPADMIFARLDCARYESLVGLCWRRTSTSCALGRGIV